MFEKQRADILTAAASFPAGETKSVLLDLAGLSRGKGGAPFAALVNEGKLIPCTVIKGNGRGKPYAGFKLP